MMTGLMIASVSIILFGVALTNLGMAILLLGCLVSPAIYRKKSWTEIPTALWIGLVLFGWMALSAFWSVGIPENIFESIRKYREFLLLPIMLIGVRQLGRLSWVREVMYGSLLISVLVSFLLWLDWIDIPGSELSLKNRIFFGISTSVFFYWSLLRTSTAGFVRWYGMLSALLAVFSLLVIENGRTGYVITITFLGIYLWSRYPGWNRRLVWLTILAGVLYGIYYLDDGLAHRVNESIINLNANVNSDRVSSVSYRIEFYRNTVRGWQSAPLVGHGVGSFPTSIELFYNPDRPWGLTDNPHQQYLLFLYEGGVVAFVLFCLFLLLLMSNAMKKNNRHLQGVVIAMSISCLFNSSFLDSGDGNFYCLVILYFLTLSFEKSQQDIFYES